MFEIIGIIAVALWAALVAVVVAGAIVRAVRARLDPWGRKNEQEAAEALAWEELERYAATGDALYLEAAASLMFLAGHDLPVAS